MLLFKKVFGYDTLNKMLQTLHDLKSVHSYSQEAFSIENTVVKFGDRVKKMPEGSEKNERKKILKIVSKILDFCLHEWNQQGERLNILTPIQMLSRLPISLVRINAGNDSEKLKNEIRQLLYYLYRSKKPAKQLHKSLIDII